MSLHRLFAGAGPGKAYPTCAPLTERIAHKMTTLPNDLGPQLRAGQASAIQACEGNRPSPYAVAGFNLAFRIPKSASVLRALTDPKTQAAIAQSHRAAADDVFAALETRALFTRTAFAVSKVNDTGLRFLSVAWETAIQDHVSHPLSARVASWDALMSFLGVPLGNAPVGPLQQEHHEVMRGRVCRTRSRCSVSLDLRGRPGPNVGSPEQ